MNTNFDSSLHDPLVNYESFIIVHSARKNSRSPVRCVSIVFCHDTSVVQDAPMALVSSPNDASHWESVSVKSAVPVLVYVSEYQLISEMCAQVSQSLRRPADISNVIVTQIHSNED